MIQNKNLLNVIKRLSFTLLIVIIYLAGTYIPLPFADVTRQYVQAINDTPLTLLGAFSGANYARLSIFSIGLNPLMFSMVLMQILMMTKFGGFDALSQNQVQYFMHFLTLIFTIGQAIFLVSNIDKHRDLLQDVKMVAILTAGSCLVVWLCYRNVKYGVGASAPVILTGILNNTIPNIIRNVKMIFTFDHVWLWIIGFIIFILALIFFWVAFNRAYYPLKLINPSFSSNSKQMLVPIGLNTAAMMMYMVGMAILTVPIMLSQKLSSHSIFNNWKFNITISFIMAVVLFYFFMFVSFDPKDEAKGFRNNHLYIKNIIPGKPTKKYLFKLIMIISIPGALLNALQLIVGLYGNYFLGRYAGLAIIPMNIVMITLFIGSIKDQLATLLFPYKYDRLIKEER
ncbi:accessory Sec system protein translocase subunit SecY2 [Lactobacillus agrestimuris]|uniref:accessory Sec system protein translocase subunit SecY2 n=1 Tax=Lactobacillus agrestimuris TaxID=2941328 RepID=UPI002043C76A|nr:accessory Sec system protein translocase subunit SecY2 [Lactobacillus agrestimuris]